MSTVRKRVQQIGQAARKLTTRLIRRRRPSDGFLVFAGLPSPSVEVDGALVDLGPDIAGFCMVPPGEHEIRLPSGPAERVEIQPGAVVVRTVDPATRALVRSTEDLAAQARQAIQSGELTIRLTPLPGPVAHARRLLPDLVQENRFKSFDLLLVDLAFAAWQFSPSAAAGRVYEQALARNEGFSAGERLDYFVSLAVRVARHLERRPALAGSFAVQSSASLLAQDLRGTGDERAMRAAERLTGCVQSALDAAAGAVTTLALPREADRRRGVHLRGGLLLFIWLALAVAAPAVHRVAYLLVISPLFLVGIFEVFGIDLIARLRHLEILWRTLRRK